MTYFERFHCPSHSDLCAAADSATEVVYMSMFYVPSAQRSIILKGDLKTILLRSLSFEGYIAFGIKFRQEQILNSSFLILNF